MRIMTDTNVIISAILFPKSQITKVIQNVTEDHTLVLCPHIIDELHEIFKRKFKEKSYLLDKFLSKLSFEFVYTPADIDSARKHLPDMQDRINGANLTAENSKKVMYQQCITDYGSEHT